MAKLFDTDAMRLQETERRNTRQPLDAGGTSRRALQAGGIATDVTQKQAVQERARYFQEILDGGVETASQFWNELEDEQKTRVPDPQAFGTDQKSLLSWWQMALGEKDFQASKEAGGQEFEEAGKTLYDTRQIGGKELLETKKPAKVREPKRFPQTETERQRWELWKKEHGIKPERAPSSAGMNIHEERERAKFRISEVEGDIERQQEYVNNLKKAAFNTTFIKKDMIGNTTEVTIVDEKDRRAKLEAAQKEMSSLRKELRDAKSIARVSPGRKPKPKPDEPGVDKNKILQDLQDRLKKIDEAIAAEKDKKKK